MKLLLLAFALSLAAATGAAAQQGAICAYQSYDQLTHRSTSGQCRVEGYLGAPCICGEGDHRVEGHISYGSKPPQPPGPPVPYIHCNDPKVPC